MYNTIMLISILFIVYAYIGYPFILWALSWFAKKPELLGNSYPHVTVLFSAYNEEASIGQTLHSIVESEYPIDLLDIMVVSDGSTDRTDKIVNSFNKRRVKLLSFIERRGKNAALASEFPKAEGEILVLVDASSIFRPDSIKKLVRHFKDPKIGSVVGAKIIMDTGSSVSRGDGLYWKYESMLRSIESATGSSWVGLEGGFSAIRKDLLRIDFMESATDYAICCRICERGFKNRYDRSAKIYEPPTIGMHKEFSRKVRVIVSGIRAFFAFKHLLNPFKYPGFTFQNISHRLCRWLVPLFLITLYLSSTFSHTLMAQFLFYMQSVFYFFAFIGMFLRHSNIKPWITSIPLYFTAMNTAAFIAWFLLWKRFDIWKTTERENIVVSTTESRPVSRTTN